MISLLSIKNFQRHKKLKIKMDPHVTTFVGPSDAGKSAVIRAIQWAMTNQPRGEAFLRDGAKRVSVSLKVDGHVIKRTRGDSNTYHLDGDRLQAFGNKVPEQVSSLLKVSDINFQGQDDSRFWFVKSAGEVSKELNKIVDLQIIDSTLKNLADMNRSAISEDKLIRARLTKASSERQALAPVREASQELTALEELERESKKTSSDVVRLSTLLSRALRTKTQRTRLGQALKQGNEVLHVGVKWIVGRRGRQALSRLIQDLVLQSKLTQVEIPSLTEIQRQAKAHKKTCENIFYLDVHLARHEEAHETRVKSIRRIKALTAKLRKFEVCPACQQKIEF